MKIKILIIVSIFIAICSLYVIKQKGLTLLLDSMLNNEIVVSNMRIDPDNKYAVVSSNDPIIMVSKENKSVIDINKLDNPTNLDTYVRNFRKLGYKCKVNTYNIGNRMFDGIEATANDNPIDKEIKIIIEPTLILSIKNVSGVSEFHAIENYLKTKISWTK